MVWQCPLKAAWQEKSSTLSVWQSQMRVRGMEEMEKVCVCGLGLKCDDCMKGSTCRCRRRGRQCFWFNKFLSVFPQTSVICTKTISHWLTYLGHDAAAFSGWISLLLCRIFSILNIQHSLVNAFPVLRIWYRQEIVFLRLKCLVFNCFLMEVWTILCPFIKGFWKCARPFHDDIFAVVE